MLAVSLALSGCSIFKSDDKPTIVYEERPVELLYNTGALRLDQHRWDEAVEYFQEVEALRAIGLARCASISAAGTRPSRTSRKSSASTPIRSGRAGRS